jgi:hypothetical protein
MGTLFDRPQVKEVTVRYAVFVRMKQEAEMLDDADVAFLTSLAPEMDVFGRSAEDVECAQKAQKEASDLQLEMEDSGLSMNTVQTVRCSCSVFGARDI